jgi:hypothetical protein
MSHAPSPPPDDARRDAFSRLLGEIVRSLLPVRPALPAEERAAVEAEVVRAVAAQLASMSTALRLGVRTGLLAFRALPLVRWGRTFPALDETHRRAWIRTWDESGVGPMPALVKLLRSCILFAWFDHPRVAAALAAGGRE